MGIVKPDPYSQVPIFLRLLFEGSELATATGFFYRSNEEVHLVSNWHNFSGRNPRTADPLSTTAGVPNAVSCYLCCNEEYIVREWCDFDLMNGAEALWYEHPKYGREVDIGVLPVEVPDAFRPFCINDIRTKEMRLRVSHEVFVLGYPLGLADSHGLPLWKRASFASVPGGSKPSFLVDTATRQGMSGAPVIHRYRGFYKYDETTPAPGPEDWFGEGDSFVGIYSGRLGASELEAQLGIVWKEYLIEETIHGKRRYEC